MIQELSKTDVSKKYKPIRFSIDGHNKKERCPNRSLLSKFEKEKIKKVNKKNKITNITKFKNTLKRLLFKKIL